MNPSVESELISGDPAQAAAPLPEDFPRPGEPGEAGAEPVQDPPDLAQALRRARAL